MFIEPLPSNDRVIDRTTEYLFYDTDRTENDESNNSSAVACICCRENVFAEPLPSDYRRDTYRDRLMGGFYEVRP
jgi:hypothetical protein